MASNIYIPDDILLSNILRRLPVKSLLRFKCVCKTWKHHIENWGSNPTIIFTSNRNPKSIYQLIDLHSSSLRCIEHPLPSSLDDHDYTRIICSCNDLFLLQAGDHYILWNPSNPTEFSEITFEKDVRKMYGFGYDYHNDDYMFIWNHSKPDKRGRLWGEMSGLKNPKSIRLVNIPGARFSWMHTSSAYLNNCLHWLQELSVQIQCYDLHKTSFCRVQGFPVPHKNYKGGCKKFNLGIYGGLLGVVMRGLDNKNSDLWVMKEYGVYKSWTKLFSLPPLEKKPTRFDTSDYKVLLLGNQSDSRVLLLDRNSNSLVWYDYRQEENNIEKIEIEGSGRIEQVVVSGFNVLQEHSVIEIYKKVESSKRKRRSIDIAGRIPVRTRSRSAMKD